MTNLSMLDRGLKNNRDEHQLVKPFKLDNKTLGYISIHNTNLGPALGGTRIFPYKSIKEARKDALLLSRAMTYKCAIAGLPFGGGKGVITASPGRKNLREILKQYAKEVKKLKGLFHTGEDVGLSEENVQYMLKFSPYFIGKSHMAGDPSPFAGQSAFLCAQVANKFINGTTSFAGKSVLIKGVGKTGSALARLFATDGAKVYVCDINKKAVKALSKDIPSLRTVNPNSVFSLKLDLYAPCALGPDLNRQNIKKIKAQLIVGTANNQLEDMDVAENLYQSGILHVPDYVANAGGLINVADELLPGGYSRRRVESNIKKLQKTLEEILIESKKSSQNPNLIANEKAERIFFKKKFSNTAVKTPAIQKVGLKTNV